MSRVAAMTVTWEEMSEAIQANPRRNTALERGASASSSVVAMPAPEAVTWLPGWSEDTTFTVTDVVSFSLWISDPMYQSATASVRRIMETEEATALLNGMEEAWKTLNGKARGWVRKHLEEDLRARSAGADPSTDAWEMLRTVKRTAQLADYICIVRNIRLALWWPTASAVSVLPLSGVSTDKIVQINCDSGHVLVDAGGSFRIAAAAWPACLYAAAAAESPPVWTQPLCAPSVGSMTVSQIIARLTEVAGPLIEGSKWPSGRAVLWTRLLWESLVVELTKVTPQPLP